MIFCLKIVGTEYLNDFTILLFGPPKEYYAVACVCYEYVGALPYTVQLGDLHAYATRVQPRACGRLQADLQSNLLSSSTCIDFTGSKFVDCGPIKESDYAILNSSDIDPVTTGLAQQVMLNGTVPVILPINQTQLGKQETVYFGAPQIYWIGAGRFPDDQSIEIGLLLPVEWVQTAIRPLATGYDCTPVLKPFTPVDLTKGDSATATFDDNNNSFEIHYDA